MAAIITLADAVVSDLNAQETWEFTAVRTYLPKFDLTDSAVLQVQVVPKTDARTPASRGYDACEMTIDIGVMQRVEGTAAEEQIALDGLMDLAEQIKEYLSRRRPTDYSAAVCTAVRNDPIYDVEQLDNGRVFLTVISTIFYVERPCST